MQGQGTHVSAATSGTTTSMPVNTALSPGRTLSTWSLRSTTSRVRGRLPAGTYLERRKGKRGGGNEREERR